MSSAHTFSINSIYLKGGCCAISRGDIAAIPTVACIAICRFGVAAVATTPIFDIGIAAPNRIWDRTWGLIKYQLCLLLAILPYITVSGSCDLAIFREEIVFFNRFMHNPSFTPMLPCLCRAGAADTAMQAYVFGVYVWLSVVPITECR